MSSFSWFCVPLTYLHNCASCFVLCTSYFLALQDALSLSHVFPTTVLESAIPPLVSYIGDRIRIQIWTLDMPITTVVRHSKPIQHGLFNKQVSNVILNMLKYSLLSYNYKLKSCILKVVTALSNYVPDVEFFRAF